MEIRVTYVTGTVDQYPIEAKSTSELLTHFLKNENVSEIAFRVKEDIGYDDIGSFWEAMKNEYVKHYPKQGDSWKHCEVDWLDELATKAMEDFFEDEDLENLDHLLDIANFCAFLWIRTKKSMTVVDRL